MGIRVNPELEAKIMAGRATVTKAKTIPTSGPKRKADTSTAATATQSRSKYRNRPVVIDGVRFDSRKEAGRYTVLLALQHAGAICDLRRQVVYPLVVNGVLVCRYVADFAYCEAGRDIVEDVKSPITRKHPVYRIKRKLMAALLEIEVRET